MKIGIGSSNGGLHLKEKVMNYLKESGCEITDYKEEGNDISKDS